MIRMAQVEDIKNLVSTAKSFALESQYIDFDENYWMQSWETLVLSSHAVIFMTDDGHGMLGGLVYPDISSGKLCAVEAFWYVMPHARGNGVLLMEAFESWALNLGCKRVIMVHLSDVMPDKVKSIYKRKGYKEMETHYVKELSHGD